MTNSQRVLKLLWDNPDGLDDDEISTMLGIEPRQQVYQICTRLESAGEIVRQSVEKPGKRRKIHNFPANAADSDTPVSPYQMQETPKWQQRLKALIAATGLSEKEILDRALADYAVQFLRDQTHES